MNQEEQEIKKYKAEVNAFLKGVSEEELFSISVNTDLNKVINTIGSSIYNNMEAIYCDGDANKIIEVYKKIQELETKLMINRVNEMKRRMCRKEPLDKNVKEKTEKKRKKRKKKKEEKKRKKTLKY